VACATHDLYSGGTGLYPANTENAHFAANFKNHRTS
jgi:hypothetical protein